MTLVMLEQSIFLQLTKKTTMYTMWTRKRPTDTDDQTIQLGPHNMLSPEEQKRIHFRVKDDVIFEMTVRTRADVDE